MQVASVIIDLSTRTLDRAFDYAVPSELEGAVAIGCIVSVEFGSRPQLGFVIGLAERPDARVFVGEGRTPRGHIRPLLGVLSASYFDQTAAQLAEWISHEYLCPLSDAVRLFAPPGGMPKMKRVDGEWTLVHAAAGEIDDRWVHLTEAAAEFKPRANAIKQQRVLEALSCGGMRVAELALELGAVNATLKALESRGVVEIERRRVYRQAMQAVAPENLPLVTLTPAQQEAVAAIEAAPAGGVVVVDGITGSGKTEVYLRAIASALAAGKSACVLVPEISLTPQTVGRFRARFGDQVAVLHSRLSVGERFDQWSLIQSGQAQVVVGARSALFAPLRNLGIVIIDEEHEGSYKQDKSPRYSAREVAVHLAVMRGAKLVLGSATPAIETLHACTVEHRCSTWSRVELPERPNGQPLPLVTVVDMAAEFAAGHRSMFSRALQTALAETLERREKAVFLLNQRGFASFLLCRDCGFVPECVNCSTSLTYHEYSASLSCHHCNYQAPVPGVCPQCGSPYLKKFGAGTERVEAELEALLPEGSCVVRMDADTTSAKGAHEKLLEQFAATPGAVLLGTQMIAKGLDFPDVTLVGVINADTTLKLPDFRAPERTFQLLEQVAGRAGRAEKPGRVIVQTYWPNHPAILAAAAHKRSAFLEPELQMRQELGYPPYRRLANVLAWGNNSSEVKGELLTFTLALQSALESAGRNWQVLGPAPCVISRRRGAYRWHTLIKAPPGANISAVLEPLLAKRKPHENVRLAIDIDPFDLF